MALKHLSKLAICYIISCSYIKLASFCKWFHKIASIYSFAKKIYFKKSDWVATEILKKWNNSNNDVLQCRLQRYPLHSEYKPRPKLFHIGRWVLDMFKIQCIVCGHLKKSQYRLLLITWPLNGFEVWKFEILWQI